MTVAAVQGNVPRLGLDFNAQRRAVLDNHVRETEQLAATSPPAAPAPDVVDLAGELVGHRPAAQSPTPPTRSTAPRGAIKAPILVGRRDREPGYGTDNPRRTR